MDFGDGGRLREELGVDKELDGGWDYMIDCGGVSKWGDKEKFEKGNYVYRGNFVEGLRRLEIVGGEFVYMS